MSPQQTRYTNEFAKRLDTSKTEEERDQIVRDFGRAPEQVREEAKDDFMRFLEDDRDTREHNNIRSYAAVFLGLIGGHDAYEFLVDRMFEEENDVVLKWIVKVVMEKFDEESRFEEAFRKYTEEQGGIIFARQVIVGAIAECAERARAAGGDEAGADEIGPFGREILLEAVSDLYWEVRMPAIRALGQMAERSAVPPLIRLLQTPRPEQGAAETRSDRTVSSSERARIIDALAGIGDARAVGPILAVLDGDEEPRPVRRAAAEALGVLGRAASDEQRDAIISTLIEQVCRGGRADRVVAYTATHALQKILGDRKAARELSDYGLRCGEEHLDTVADAIRLIDPGGAVRHLQRRMRNQWREEDRRGGRAASRNFEGGNEVRSPESRKIGEAEVALLDARARKLIAAIGGEFALEALADDETTEKTQFWSNALAVVLLGFSALSGAYVVLVTLNSRFGDIASGLTALSAAGALLGVFLASILVAFPARIIISSFRYLMSILLAFLFSVGMVFTLSLSLWALNEEPRETASPEDAYTYGPVTLFRHAPPDGQATWFVSLSAALESGPRATSEAGPSGEDPAAGARGAPSTAQAATGSVAEPDQTDASPAPVDTAAARGATAAPDDAEPAPRTAGFEAPLWVLLLATIGAGLLTVSLIVKELNDRPNFRDQDEMRGRLGQVIQHQFFILFAPLGAIFVYQGLVAVGADAEPLTVALAALGAGASLNFVLERAVRSSRQALNREEAQRGRARGAAAES